MRSGSRPTVGNVTTVAWRVLDDVRPLAAAVPRPAADVDPVAVDAFARDGVVVVRSAFPEWVEPLRAGLERTLADPGRYAFPSEAVAEGEPGRFHDSYCNWQLVPEYLAFVLASSAASMAATFMASPTAQLFHDHAFAKEPGTAKATPWHQDLPYYCVDGRRTVSLYVALDPVPEDVSVRFWKGSHRSGRLHLPRGFARGESYLSDDPELTPVPDVEAVAPPDEILVAPLQPGDALVFDFRTLHGSSAAVVQDRRRAFSTRWLGDDVVHVTRPGETSPPLDDLDLVDGVALRDDWFPILWPPERVG